MSAKKYALYVLAAICVLITLLYLRERSQAESIRTYYKHKQLQLEEQSKEKEKLIQQLKCNPFFEDGDKILIPPLCDVEDTLTQGYGLNPHAYGGKGMPVESHSGVDFVGEEGTPIRAAHSGTIFEVHDMAKAGYHGYGNYIKIRQRSGEKGYETVYGHMLSMVVEAGESVRQGQLIGYMGNTGISSRPHVHFGIRFLYFCNENNEVWNPCEVIDGKNGNLGWIDPMPYIAKQKTI